MFGAIAKREGIKWPDPLIQINPKFQTGESIEEKNLVMRMEDKGFLIDTIPIVHKEIQYDPSEAVEFVLTVLQGSGYA